MKNGPLFVSKKGSGLARARARFLTQAIQLEEQEPSGLTSAAAILTLALILVAVVWSAITTISEQAHAPGRVVPEGLNHAVQHLEGGLVKALYVRNGDPVKRGDALLEFDQSAIESEIEQIRVRKAALDLQSERLAALIESREPRFGESGENYPVLARKQRTVYLAQLASHDGEMQVSRSQVAHRQAELVQHRNTVASLENEVALLREQVEMREQLESTRLVARTDLLVNKSQLAEVQSDLRRSKDGVDVARSALEETRQRATEIRARFLKELELEAGAAATELAEVWQTLVRLEDRLRRAELRATIDGIVQGLTVTSSNTVVEPGQIIMEIVPVNNRMLVEARVSPSDIGHVKIGQPVDVKIDSYDPARFGSVGGKVERVSANTYLDEKAAPYFRSEISLSRAYLGTRAGELRIIPGMTVTAEITTGSKTLLDYLLKPVKRGLNTAFTER